MQRPAKCSTSDISPQDCFFIPGFSLSLKYMYRALMIGSNNGKLIINVNRHTKVSAHGTNTSGYSCRLMPGGAIVLIDIRRPISVIIISSAYNSIGFSNSYTSAHHVSG